MFRSFFPSPKVYFPAAIAWVAVFMTIWFTAGGWLEQYLSLGPWLGLKPSTTGVTPFFDASRVWLYQYILVVGYLFAVPWYIWGNNRRWLNWSVLGSITIIEVVYFNVQISAWLNEWYGQFYDLIQKALAKPNAVTIDEFFGFLVTVAIVLTASITIIVVNSFLNSHYLFRWRRAMTFFYMANWKSVRHVEGASQRIQEDTRDFVSIVESIGLSFIDSVMTLIVFLPLLWGLSQHITDLPWIGHVEGSLVWVALVSAAFGTALLWGVGIRLPGLTFHNQRVEAAFRKELVYGEDHDDNARPASMRDFFRNVQSNYFRLYFNYLYFNVARYAYLQGAVFIPYIAIGPSIVTAAITLGLFQQILQAFGQVSDSFRFLVNSWTSIINLISIHKRLVGFESNLPKDAIFANDYDDPRYLESWENMSTPPTETTPIAFQWALVGETEPGADTESAFVTVWYDLKDRDKYPGSRTRETSFAYSSELAASVRSAMDAIRAGKAVNGSLEFYQLPERTPVSILGIGAITEAEVSHGRVESLESRIRPLSVTLDVPSIEPA